MEFFYNYPLYAMILSNAVLLLGAAIAILRLDRLINEERSCVGRPTDTAMQQDSDSETVLSDRLEHRLTIISDRIDDLSRQRIPVGNTVTSDFPFDYAVRMAKHGASVDDLTRTCGLNKAEARLMWQLHARQRDAKTPAKH